MSEPEEPASTSTLAMHLQLVDEITRLSRLHIDLAATLERQTRLLARLQQQQQTFHDQHQIMRADLGLVAANTTRNAEILFDRAALRIDAFEQDLRSRGELLSDLSWYPTWSEVAPLSADLLISVVIPTRNRRDLLERAFGSLVRQSYQNWEAVVVDDASIDDTAALVRSFVDMDDRFRLIPSDGSGCAAARQRALGEANGQIVTYLDDDNLMGHGWLRAVAEYFGRNTAVDVVYGAQLRAKEDASPSGAQPFVLFEPYDEIRLAESNFIDMGVVAHRAGLAVKHPAGVRGVDDWSFILDLAELCTLQPLPVIASIYLTASPDRDSQQSDHHVSEESTRSRSAHRRMLQGGFIERSLRSTRDGSNNHVGSPVPGLTRLDGEILLFVLVALARRQRRPLRVVDWSADERARSIVQFLTSAVLETNWLCFRSGPVGDETVRTLQSVTEEVLVSNSLTPVTSLCCTTVDGGNDPDDAIEEPACVQLISDLGVEFDAMLVDSRVECPSLAAARSFVGADGVVLVHTDDVTSVPDFLGYASSARIGHRLWIASPNETDFAAIVPIRGLIEGNMAARTEHGSDRN